MKKNNSSSSIFAVLLFISIFIIIITMMIIDFHVIDAMYVSAITILILRYNIKKIIRKNNN